MSGGLILNDVDVLIVPTCSPAHSQTKAKAGTLLMSGAKLYVAVADGDFRLITSA